ncbi:MAG: hypothetical protein GQ574_15740 [Crocinitomix sp.]|nr:hypothetical protein [Crocinitomix sp.]
MIQTIYSYEKRPELSELLTGTEEYYKLKSKITEYFHEKLIAGTYTNLGQDTVYFKPTGELIGLSIYNEFIIDSYFGTSHPFQNLDMLRLRNHDKHVLDFYHWEFKKEQLILTEFVRDTMFYNNEWVGMDDFVLTDKQIRLRLVKRE